MRKRRCLFLLLAALVVADAPSSTSFDITTPVLHTPSSTYSTPLTCESRAINYITHRLPQQCLNAAAWSGASRQSTPTVSLETANLNRTDKPTESIATESNASQGSVKPTGSESTQQESTLANNATVSETATGSSTIAPTAPADEADSALDNAHFLSFEDWKKQTLEHAGQDSDKLGSKRGAGPTTGEPRRRPGSNNALEGLGDEAEIEIDFGGFRATRQNPQDPRQNQPGNEQQKLTPPLSEDGADMLRMRSKDAGKTCKERFNYASFDCAANVLKTNGKVKHASSILVENKDSYMTSECSVDNKFVIVELCDDVLIDTVVLANYEFFASSFHTFRISVSSTYPVKIDKWITLGTFEARNTREIQAFLIENGQIFARYMRIEFITHYGNQYYCPLSLIRVHGMTMFDHYKLWRQYQQGEIDADGESEGEEETALETAQAGDIKVASQEPVKSESVDQKAEQSQESKSLPQEPNSTSPIMHAETQQSQGVTADTTASVTARPIPSSATPVILDAIPNTSSQDEQTSSTSSSNGQSSTAAVNSTASTAQTSHSQQTSQSAVSHSTPSQPSNTTTSVAESKSTSKNSTASQEATKDAKSQTFTATQATASANAAPPPQVPQPATQESFFKSIHKRLQSLEANSTLSMQYIESQSQILREAFSKVDKRNIAKTSEFLEKLNTTVLAELSRFKSDYEQLWQSTVLELASQRDEGRRERELLSDQVKLLADEVVSQKRLQAAQATLLLLCLGFVVFARVGSSSVGDTAFMQNVQGFVSKQRKRHMPSDSFSSRRWPWESPWISPSVTRPVSRRGPFLSEAEEAIHDTHDRDAHNSSDSDEVSQVSHSHEKMLPPESEESSPNEPSNGHLRQLTSKIETRSAPTTPRLERDQLLEFSELDNVS